jgi:hypothetical protein
MEYVIGLDLGQKQDYTAVALIEKHDHRVRGEKPFLYLRHLERYALGTPYGEVADRVAELVDRTVEKTNKEAYPYLGTPELIVDSTGVGAGVAEMLKDRDLHYRPVMITGGTAHDKREGGVYRVAKQELVSRAVAPFESKRLKISRRMALVGELVEELENFKIKVNVDTANASFEAWRGRDHDDLVLALALACWWCERRWKPVLGPVPLPPALRGSPRTGGRTRYRNA